MGRNGTSKSDGLHSRGEKKTNLSFYVFVLFALEVLSGGALYAIHIVCARPFVWAIVHCYYSFKFFVIPFFLFSGIFFFHVFVVLVVAVVAFFADWAVSVSERRRIVLMLNNIAKRNKRIYGV